MKGFFESMKKSILTAVAVLLSFACLVCLISCDVQETPSAEGGLWENAIYSADAEVGEGARTVTFTVEAEDKIVTITLKTDKENLGEAMFEQGLINDASFFSVLNGIEASWEKDQAYWGFYQDDELMPYGVNDQKIEGGESYRFVYTK